MFVSATVSKMRWFRITQTIYNIPAYYLIALNRNRVRGRVSKYVTNVYKT
jgi:hypothetical protein